MTERQRKAIKRARLMEYSEREQPTPTAVDPLDAVAAELARITGELAPVIHRVTAASYKDLQSLERDALAVANQLDEEHERLRQVEDRLWVLGQEAVRALELAHRAAHDWLAGRLREVGDADEVDEPSAGAA